MWQNTSYAEKYIRIVALMHPHLSLQHFLDASATHYHVITTQFADVVTYKQPRLTKVMYLVQRREKAGALEQTQIYSR